MNDLIELLEKASKGANDDDWLRSIGINPHSGFIFGRDYSIGRFVGVKHGDTLLVGFSQPTGDLLFSSGQTHDGKPLLNIVNAGDEKTIQFLLKETVNKRDSSRVI